MNRRPAAATVTCAQRAARADEVAVQLERIAYRLRQGAISDELAAAKLTAIALDLDPETSGS